MLANLLGVAGVKHVITVDLHASQMQGFFRCPVDNLHAEPIIAKWIRHNVPNWREAVVVSKNAGGTKRVTSLADALKLSFGMVTTDRRRGGNMSASMIMNHLDNPEHQPSMVQTSRSSANLETPSPNVVQTPRQKPIIITEPPESPMSVEENFINRSSSQNDSGSGSGDLDAFPAYNSEASMNNDVGYDDRQAQEVIQGRLIRGHIVEDDAPSPARSTTENSPHEEDDMTMSHASSYFVTDRQSLGGTGDAVASSDEEDNALSHPTAEHMITLVGNVKNKAVFIVDDMIDKPGSWIAAAETVMKKGHAKKVYCIATHGVFGGDCLEQLQACDCIDTVVVTNSFPIDEERGKKISKLVVLDLSFLLAEAIRRNHYGESISPLFQHYGD